MRAQVSILAAFVAFLACSTAYGQTNRIEGQGGFSVHQVVRASRGAAFDSDKPEPSDQMVAASNGRTYRLRSKPIIVGGITGVRVEPSRKNEILSFPIVWLHLSPHESGVLARFTSTHLGNEFAYVLNGRVVGSVVDIPAPLQLDSVPVIAVTVEGDLTSAEELAREFSSTIKERDAEM